MTLGGVALIALGGAAGTLARFGLVEAAKRLHPAPETPAFPWGTLAVNLLGCFAIGYLATAMTVNVREDLRAAVFIGVLGGFTTFSSFAWETQSLWSAGRITHAAAYVAVSVTAGVLLAFAGKRLAGG